MQAVYYAFNINAWFYIELHIVLLQLFVYFKIHARFYTIF